MGMKICLKAYATVAFVMCGISVAQASELRQNLNNGGETHPLVRYSSSTFSKKPDQECIDAVIDALKDYCNNKDAPIGEYNSKNTIYVYCLEFLNFLKTKELNDFPCSIYYTDKENKAQSLTLVEVIKILEYETSLRFPLFKNN